MQFARKPEGLWSVDKLWQVVLYNVEQPLAVKDVSLEVTPSHAPASVRPRADPSRHTRVGTCLLPVASQSEELLLVGILVHSSFNGLKQVLIQISRSVMTPHPTRKSNSFGSSLCITFTNPKLPFFRCHPSISFSLDCRSIFHRNPVSLCDIDGDIVLLTPLRLT